MSGDKEKEQEDSKICTDVAIQLTRDIRYAHKRACEHSNFILAMHYEKLLADVNELRNTLAQIHEALK
jgi:hypothetical protein